MTENKKTVQQYMDGFMASDHAKILDCLADDIVWYMPGFIHLTGKEAFDKEIENDYFIGSPTIKITRMVEENNIVAAEDAVQCKKKDGGMLDALFFRLCLSSGKVSDRCCVLRLDMCDSRTPTTEIIINFNVSNICFDKSEYI